MAVARTQFAAGQFALAVESADRALRIVQSDPAAKDLRDRALYAENMRLAHELAGENRYSQAAQKIGIALAAQPTSQEAKMLLAQYKAAADDSRRDRVTKISDAFDALVQKLPEAALFDLYEFRTSTSASEVEKAILQLVKIKPRWEVARYGSTIPHEFALETAFEFGATDDGTPAGRRRVIVLGADVGAGETLILFKVLEYRPVGVGNLLVQSLLTGPGTNLSKYTPISKSAASTNPKLEAQLTEGLTLMSDFFETALGKESVTEPVHKKDAPKRATSQNSDSR
jgi:tetratricopeptide (TPR) repeat protein